MQRRRAAAAAGAAAATALAALLGLGATFGLFGLTQPDSNVGGTDRSHVATLTGSTTGPMPDD